MARVGLTRERLVEMAIELIDRDGYSALSLSTLADTAGVRVPSLYKHVHSLADLQQLLAIEGQRRLGLVLEQAVSGSSASRSKDLLLRVAEAYRKLVLQHPGLYEATLRAPDPTDARLGAAAGIALDSVYKALAQFDLSDTDRLDAARLAHSALHGFVNIERLGGFQMDKDQQRSLRFIVDVITAGLQERVKK